MLVLSFVSIFASGGLGASAFSTFGGGAFGASIFIGWTGGAALTDLEPEPIFSISLAMLMTPFVSLLENSGIEYHNNSPNSPSPKGEKTGLPILDNIIPCKPLSYKPNIVNGIACL
jgi:hypothetical protein